jgi:ADP-ribose pyrophosphatase YjhB (NUDIX family)
MRKVICVAAIKNGKILLVKKKNVWILPGGKLENIESEQQCLIREFKEELPNVTLSDIRYYNDNFFGITPYSQKKRQAVVYFGNVSGNTTPSAEINDSTWTTEPEKFNLSEITTKIVLSLRQTAHL